MPPRPAPIRYLDHSIVGQSETTLTVRKDRNLAACRLCGAIFQPDWFIKANDMDFASAPHKRYAGEAEIIEWRASHNSKHTEAERCALLKSGLTLTPEAAHKLAPFGLVPVADAIVNGEVDDALRTSPRIPSDDVDTTLKGYK